MEVWFRWFSFTNGWFLGSSRSSSGVLSQWCGEVSWWKMPVQFLFFSGSNPTCKNESIPQKNVEKKGIGFWIVFPFWTVAHIVSTWVWVGSKNPPKLGSWVGSSPSDRSLGSLRWISPSCYAALGVLALRRWSWTSVPCRDGSLGKFSEAFRKFCRAPPKNGGFECVLGVYLSKGDEILLPRFFGVGFST